MPQHTISVSQIGTYQTCPRMYFFNYVMQIVPKVEDKKLLFGRGIHVGLEAYYRSRSLQECLVAYNTWLTEETDRLRAFNTDPNQMAESARIGEQLLIAYDQFATSNDSFTPVSVEAAFEVPVWTPKHNVSRIRHKGKIDLIVRDMYGKLWLGEHKTARDAPSDLELRLNFQASVYLLAAHQLFDEPVCGIIYNVIRKVDPRRAKTPVITRTLVPRTAQELLSTAAQLYSWSRKMLTDKEYLPVPGRHCGWRCAYDILCQCMQEGSDYTQLVDALYIPKEVIDYGADENNAD